MSQGPAWHHLETTLTSRVMEIFPKSCSLQGFSGLACPVVWSSPQSPHRVTASRNGGPGAAGTREHATYSTRDWIKSAKKSNFFWYGHSYKFIMLLCLYKRCSKLPLEHLWNSLMSYLPWQKDSTLQQPLSVHYKAGFMAPQQCQVSSFARKRKWAPTSLLWGMGPNFHTCKQGQQGRRGTKCKALQVQPQWAQGGHSVLAAAGYPEIMSLSTDLIELQMSFLMAICRQSFN